MVIIAYKMNIVARALFLALHLLHRVYEEYFRRYPEPTKWFRLLACICFNVSTIINMEQTTFSLNTWKILSNGDKVDDYDTHFMEITILVLDICGGNISALTAWNYACSKEELPSLLQDMLTLSYDSTQIRVSTTNISNKCVQTGDFIDEAGYEYFLKNFILPTYMSPIYVKGKVSPCELKLEPDMQVIERGSHYSSTEDIIVCLTALMHNRAVLNSLCLNTAVFIFDRLYYGRVNSPVLKYILDIICNYDWEKHGLLIIQRCIHPFKLTDDVTEAELLALPISKYTGLSLIHDKTPVSPETLNANNLSEEERKKE